MNFWLNKKVLVTGCTGLVGSWLSKHLCELGAEVTGLIRDAKPNTLLKQNGTQDIIKVVRGDLRDQALLERVINEHQIEVVFHLGAQTQVGIANRSPVSTFESNIKGTWTLLEAARQIGVKAFVVASSDKAYGVHESLPYNETAPLVGSFPYDVSKSCTDLITRCYAKSYGVPTATTRCGNIFGGGDLNFRRLIPDTIRLLVNNEVPVIRSDGKFVRDYIYVEDVVSAYLTTAEAVYNGKFHGEAFNFSLEDPKDVLEVVNELQDIIGTSFDPVIKNEASNEIREQYLSCAKAKELLGWTPKFTFNEAMTKTVEWYRKVYQDA